MSAKVASRRIEATVSERGEQSIFKAPSAFAVDGSARGIVRRLRLKRRMPAFESIVVQTARGARAAHLVDKSETGIGILSSEPLEIGSTVRLTFVDGSVVDGAVVWNNGDRYGISFRAQVAAAAAQDQHQGYAGNGPAVGRTVPTVRDALKQLGAAVAASLASSNPLGERGAGRRERMFERAWRKNGNAWLLSDEADDASGRLKSSEGKRTIT